MARREFAVAVLMQGKPCSTQKEHRQQAGHGPSHGPLERLQMVGRMRQQLKQGHAEHQPGYDADHHLQPRWVSTNSEGSQPPASDANTTSTQ